MITRLPFRYTCTTTSTLDGKFGYVLKREGKYSIDEPEMIEGDILLTFKEPQDIAIGDHFEVVINRTYPLPKV